MTLVQFLLLAFVLLGSSLGQQRRGFGNSRAIFTPTSKSFGHRQLSIARARAKMQNAGTTSANRRLVRADPNADSRPISFGAPGPNRNNEQPIGFGSKGNSPSAGDRTSHPQVPPGGGDSSTTSPDNKPRQFRTRESPRCTNNSRATPCERDSDYDEEISGRIRAILRESRMNAILESSAVTDLLQDSALVKDKAFSGGLNTRFGDFVTATPACQAQESIIYPQRAKTTSDDWVFVINQDSVKQGVRVEKCIREGISCDLGVGTSPITRTSCHQKFIYRKLLVLSDSGSDVQPESVLIPSCCVCYISRPQTNSRNFDKTMLRNRRTRKRG